MVAFAYIIISAFNTSNGSQTDRQADRQTDRQTDRQIRWNRELTLECKLKCYVKPMKDPLGVSPSKGNQETTRGKENNSFDLGGIRTHDLRIRSTVTVVP